MAFVTAKTVPTVIDIAFLTCHTFQTEDGIGKASAALVAVRLHKADCICTLDAACAAHTAAVFVPVVVAAMPAIHAVLVVGVDVSGGKMAYQHNYKHKYSYDLAQRFLFHLFFLPFAFG